MNLIDILTSPWAIMPEKYHQICAILDAHLRGPKLNLKDIEAKITAESATPRRGYGVKNGMAIIPIVGPIAKNPDIFDRVLFGMASSMQIRADFDAALADSAVDSIMLYIDSPGGTVDGTQELARTIYAARGTKPVVAFSDGLIASAAYWIGAAADRLYISGDTVWAGSVGVIATHVDLSEADRQAGIKVTEIVAGKYKNIGSPNEPLTTEGRAYIQERVDHIYSVFVSDVAQFRGTTPEAVIENMADGRIFVGKNAITAGLVDGMATIEQIADKSLINAGAGVAPAAHIIKNEMEAQMNISVETLAKDYPEIYQAVLDAGKAEAKKTIDAELAAAREEGAKAELERIKGIRAVAMPGYEAMIEAMMIDGKTDGAQAAMKIIAAEKERCESNLKKMQASAPEPVAVPEAPEPEPVKPEEDENAPIENRAKASWDKDAKLRAEFGNNYAAYLAYRQATAAGQARILKGGNK